MNKQLLLDWLVQDAEKHENHFVHKTKFWKTSKGNLLDDIIQVSNKRFKSLPTSLPNDPDQLATVLRAIYKNNVTPISLLLSEYQPDCFLYYNVSKLENEIFDGLAFFSEIVPEFNLPFDHVGKEGMERYLKLNQALLGFAHRCWPRQKNVQSRMLYFLYKGLGELFLNREDIRRAWILTCGDEYSASLDDKTTWSGRKEMQAGDLIFVYRTAPKKAIADVYRAVSHAYFDPYWSWHGFKVDMELICELPEIPFSQLRTDPVFQEWGVIKRQFQGVTAEPIPNRVYNHLLNLIPEDIRVQHGIQPAELSARPESGKFCSEAEFDEQFIAPLINKLGLKAEYQHSCPFYIGSQEIRGRIDYLVKDERGPLTLFEDKLRIRPDRPEDLQKAVNQARSYALMLGLHSFVVAAPEGLWIYSLKNYQLELARQFSLEELTTGFDEVRTILERLR